MPEKDKVIARLSPERKKQVEDTQAIIPEVNAELDALERMGLDVSSLREKVNWADGVGKELLTTFGK